MNPLLIRSPWRQPGRALSTRLPGLNVLVIRALNSPGSSLDVLDLHISYWGDVVAARNTQ